MMIYEAKVKVGAVGLDIIRLFRHPAYPCTVHKMAPKATVDFNMVVNKSPLPCSQSFFSYKKQGERDRDREVR